MIGKLNGFLAARSLFQIACLSLVITGLVGLADLWTGPMISMAVFYLIPISIAAWYADGKTAVGMALLASAIMFALDIPKTGIILGRITSLWNGMTHLGFFLTTAYLVRELRVHLEAERKLARTDPLTGLMNRRAFMEQFEMFYKLAVRRNSPLTIAYIDLDDFKLINDRDGHEAGDQVLQIVGAAMKTHCRCTDLVARMGGDEFVIVLPDTDLQAAQTLLTKMRDVLHGKTVNPRRISCSAGVVTFISMPPNVHEALRVADVLMYRVKERGKNGVAFHVYDSSSRDAMPAASRSS